MTTLLSLKTSNSHTCLSQRKPGPKLKGKRFQYDRSLRSQVDTPTLENIPDDILGLFAFASKNDPSPLKKIFQNNVNALTTLLKNKTISKETLIRTLTSLPNTDSFEDFHYEAFSRDIKIQGLRPRDRDIKVFLIVFEEILKAVRKNQNPDRLSVWNIIKNSSLKHTTSENKRNFHTLLSLSHIKIASKDKKNKNPMPALKPLFTLSSDYDEQKETLFGTRGQLKFSKLLKSLHLDLKNSFLKDLVTERIRESKDSPPIYERQGHYKPWAKKSYLSGQSFAIPHPVKSGMTMPDLRIMALLDAHRPMTEEVLFTPKQRTYSLNAMAHIAGRKGDLKDTKHRDRFLNLLQDVSKTTFDLSCEGDKVTTSPEDNILERLTVFHGFSPETLDTLKSESQKISSAHENYQTLNLDLDQKSTHFKSSISGEDTPQKSSISGEDTPQKSSISGEDTPQKSSISGEDRPEGYCYDSENQPLSLYNKSLYILSVYKREGDRLTKDVLRAFQNLLSLPQKRIFEQALKYFKINIWQHGELTCKSKFMGLIRPIVERFACDMIRYCNENGLLLDKMLSQKTETRPVSVVQTSKLSNLEVLCRELQADENPTTLEKNLVKSALSHPFADTASVSEVKSFESSAAVSHAVKEGNYLIKHDFGACKGDTVRVFQNQRVQEPQVEALKKTEIKSEKPEVKMEKTVSGESHTTLKSSPFNSQSFDKKEENKKTVTASGERAHKVFETAMENKLLEIICPYVKESHRERVINLLGSQNHIQLKLFKQNLSDMRTDSLMRGFLKRYFNLSSEALIFKKTGTYGGAWV